VRILLVKLNRTTFNVLVMFHKISAGCRMKGSAVGTLGCVFALWNSTAFKLRFEESI
jgi:hypothetical protein